MHRTRRPRRGPFRVGATLTVALLSAPTLLDPSGGVLDAQQPFAAPTVAGRLIGPDLQPAVGLEVQLIPVPGSYARRLRELDVADAVPVVDRTRSDAEGRFELGASRADRLVWARPGGEFALKTRADYVPPAIRIAAAGYRTKRVWLGPENYAAADRRKPIRVEMRRERRSPDR